VADAFYEPDGEGYRATELTRGPWDPGSQHAGPPAALIAHAIEGLEDAADFQVGRITFEILGAVPIGHLRPSARIARPGRRVQLIEATLEADGTEVMRAHAWRLRTAPVDIPEELLQRDVPPGPELGRHREFFPTGHDVGYHSAMEYRFLQGAYLEPGPATVWMRMRHPLVEGVETTPLQRILTAADSGNGVSATLDYREYLFINVDLTVHLERMPAGEWVGLDAITLPQPNGVGTADTILFDETGRFGRALQTLLVAKRD
jgi:hypothetical protein